MIDADGKNPIRLTDGLVDTYPDWSPDGTKIVYDAHPVGITVMDADGKDKRLLTRGVHPSWSPDGKRIAFISTVGVINHVFVMDADGGNGMQLTHDFVRKRLPSWSHDGKRIAYVGDNVIWVVDSDGENPRQLTWHVTESHPTWSPDSESIAFTSFYRDPEIIGIYTVDLTDGAVDALLGDPDIRESRSGLALSRRTLRFAGRSPDYNLGEAEEYRAQPPVRDELGRWQLTLSEL